MGARSPGLHGKTTWSSTLTHLVFRILQVLDSVMNIASESSKAFLLWVFLKPRRARTLPESPPDNDRSSLVTVLPADSS